MNNIENIMGVTMPHAAMKLKTLFPSTTAFQKDFYCRNSFNDAGIPVNRDPATIYPCYAAQYLGYALPSTRMALMPGYLETAAKAAMAWLTKLFPGALTPTEIYGETITVNLNGKDYNFCFPHIEISYKKENGELETAAVIPVPDSRENDADWEDGITPAYVHCVAMTQLWCYEQSAFQMRRDSYPEKAFVVRITGNTPGDLAVRTVMYDMALADKLMQRLSTMYSRAMSAGKDPVQYPNIIPQQEWWERRQEKQDDAYNFDNTELYALCSEYLCTKHQRKALEEKAEALGNQMDALAINLASMTETDADVGLIAAPNGYVYEVHHTKKRTTGATVSAELVRQFYPQYADLVINTSVTSKGRVEIGI